MKIEEIRLSIILKGPPPGVVFGVQEGSGSIYKTIQLQKSDQSDLTFDIPIKVRPQKEGEPVPDFAGPYVQGPKTERFIYIDIGTAAGDITSEWTRRLKIPLRGITDEMISAAAKQSGKLEVTVPGKAKDGGPNCATVKPFPGWKVAPAPQ